MKRNVFTLTILLLSCIGISAQSVQYGYTVEYRGAKDKRPLTGVNVTAGGATARSGQDGKFKLEFNTLKVGDRVYVDVNNVVALKGYVLFNKDAVEQWTVSGKSVYFNLVLCKKKYFEAAVKNYYNVSDKYYREQLKKERERVRQLQQEGEIQQAEYERLLNEAEENYRRELKNLSQNAELVARIDENELEGDEKEILRLAKEGKLGEAVELIKKGKSLSVLEKASDKREYAIGQRDFYEEKINEANGEIDRAINCIKNEMKVLALHGGSENYKLCCEYWMKIADSDTTKIQNVFDCAHFLLDQGELAFSQKYYECAMRQYEKLVDGEGIAYCFELARTYDNLGSLHRATSELDVAEDYYYKSLSIRRRMADYDSVAYSVYVAGSLNNLAVLYDDQEKYDTAEMYYKEGLEICEKFEFLDTISYNKQMALILNNLAILYFYSDRNELAEPLYVKALELYEKVLKEESTDANRYYKAKADMNIAILYDSEKQLEKSERYYMQAYKLEDELVKSNPSCFIDEYCLLMTNIGDFYLRQYEEEEAKTYYMKLYRLVEALNNENPDYYSYYMRYALRVLRDFYYSIDDFGTGDLYNEKL